MQITVVVEPMNGQGFRATGGEPFRMSAEGETRGAALQKLREEIQARIQNGAEIVAIDVALEPHPWLEFAGMFKDNPLLEEWKQAMAEYRDQVEKDDDYL